MEQNRLNCTHKIRKNLMGRGGGEAMETSAPPPTKKKKKEAQLLLLQMDKVPGVGTGTRLSLL